MKVYRGNGGEEAVPVSWTLEECQKEAEGVAMPPEEVEAFWKHYAPSGFFDGAGRRIVNLKAALVKWHDNQVEHGERKGAAANRKKKRVARNEAVRVTVEKLWGIEKASGRGCPQFALVMSEYGKEFKYLGKNQAGEDVVAEALELLKVRRQTA
jgi:hypothetical protein